ncbi:MAG: 3-hydroxyacyl-CoA dehydrogenase family protein [Thermodesulfobacteriota bacterium]
MTNITVLGAGTMGPGLAQIFAARGHPVGIYDPDQQKRAAVLDQVAAGLEPFLRLKLITPEEGQAALSRLTVREDLASACREAEVVIEAIPENMALKRQVLTEVQNLVGPEVIICSNTSALRISDLALGLPYPGRLVGTHFWNPPQIIPCVEVIRGDQTSTEVFEFVYAWLKAAGKEPVRVLKDAPGFLGNRLQHALQREAYHVLEMGLAEPEDVDRVVKYGFGLRLAIMGPLERADLGGLDVGYEIQHYLLPHLDARPTVSPVLKDKVSAGRLGYKTGRGFYDWSDPEMAGRIKRRDLVLLQLIQCLKEISPGQEPGNEPGDDG